MCNCAFYTLYHYPQILFDYLDIPFVCKMLIVSFVQLTAKVEIRCKTQKEQKENN